MFHRKSRTTLVMPILSAGRHRTPRQGACFMEFASYLAGERWSDHPPCTHPLLAALARDVNDLTTDAARDRLMPLVHRVVGLTGEYQSITTTIAVRAAAAAIPIASLERQRALAVGMLGLLAARPLPELSEIAEAALDQAPDAERWARGYLTSTRTPHGPAERAALAMVHTSVVGIALACVSDADQRLLALLETAITDVEAIVSPPRKVAAREFVLA